MDQTINEMMYKGRINSTVNAWNDQKNGKMTTGGTLIASDGTSYKKVDGKLVPILDDKLLKRVSKVVVPVLTENGLIKTATEELNCESAMVSDGLVREI